MSGAELIHQERERQKYGEGWTPEHDDQHDMAEMVGAAITYAAHAIGIITDEEVEGADFHEFWPWGQDWWKPSPDAIRNLVKAGALIAAEIDRLQRVADKEAVDADEELSKECSQHECGRCRDVDGNCCNCSCHRDGVVGGRR